MTDKKAYIQAASSGPGISYANLFNPFSPLRGGGDKIPEFMSDIFPNNQKAAWIVSKMGALGLVAAAVSGGIRGIQHLNRMAEMSDDDDPAKDLKSELSTTFEGPMSPAEGSGEKRTAVKKKAPKKTVKKAALKAEPVINPVESTEWWEAPETTLRVGLPLGALILAAGAAWKGVDYLADKHRNSVLSSAIAGKSNTVRRLMQARARLAKGTITDQELKDTIDSIQADDSYVKTAAMGQEKELEPVKTLGTSLGLLLVALTAASGVGAYRYFSASDPDNIRYKAMKQGLKEYAKSKTLKTPISLIPTDAEEYFASIDNGAKPITSPRDMQEIEGASKPLSVTL